MKPFVDDAKRLDVVAAAESWIGTRFVARARIRQGGVDCVNLAAGILEDSGFPGDLSTLPAYRLDSGHHANHSALIEWFQARPDFAPAPDDPDTGDMLVFRMGRVGYHLGVCINSGRFVHAMIHGGVKASSLRDQTWQRRLIAVFRPMV